MKGQNTNTAPLVTFGEIIERARALGWETTWGEMAAAAEATVEQVDTAMTLAHGGTVWVTLGSEKEKVEALKRAWGGDVEFKGVSPCGERIGYVVTGKSRLQLQDEFVRLFKETAKYTGPGEPKFDFLILPE